MTRIRLLTLAILLAVGCQPPQPSEAAPRPALVVLIAVDQLRPDYLVRFEPGLDGGLGWLLQEGVFYTHARQEHALTQTAPGHASMLSGRPPASTGIISNDRGVPDREHPVIGSSAAGASPARFRGSTLMDWLLAQTGDARGLSVARKDRAAILMMGRSTEPTLWYGGNGKFVTSSWYGSALPAWVEAWNDRRGVQRLAGSSWQLLRLPEMYDEPDSVPEEYGGKDPTFPHRMPDDSAELVREVIRSPWMDSLTLDLALQGVKARRLGQRNATDLLLIGLSTTDEIGHDWGPDSREMHDQILRLDRWLGLFFDSLATMVPPARMVVALTADHGVASIPALARKRGEAAWAYRDTLVGRWLNTRIADSVRRAAGLAYDHGVLLADTSVLLHAGLAPAQLRAELRRMLASDPAVARVLTPDSLARASDADTAAMLWRRSLPDDTGFLVAVVLRPGWMWSASGLANHGNPTDADIIVPLIIRDPRFHARRVDRPVRVTALAATLAGLAGVEPMESVDHPLMEFVQSPH